jgi:hypothetical protein
MRSGAIMQPLLVSKLFLKIDVILVGEELGELSPSVRGERVASLLSWGDWGLMCA